MNSPQLKPVGHRVSLVESVYATLVEAIVSGHLGPGTDLNSVVLADQLEVSRTPVKDALKLLAHDGLVRQINHHTARVTELSPDDVREIYGVRLLLESGAAELAATRMAREVLEELRREAAELWRRRDDVDWTSKALGFDERFHAAIAEAAENERLKAEIQQFRLLVRSFCHMNRKQPTLEQALAEHIEVLDALATGRAAAARKAMAKHIQLRLEAVLAHMSCREGA